MGLKIGIICVEDAIYHWQFQCIQELMATDGAQVAVLIIAKQSDPSVGCAKKLRNQEGFINSLIRKAILRSRAFANENLASLSTDTPILQCITFQTLHGETCFEAGDLHTLSELKLDLILNLTEMQFHLRSLPLLRYGLWAYQFGKPGEKSSYILPFFWEAYTRQPCVEAYLVAWTLESNTPFILRQGSFRNIKSAYTSTLTQVLLESARWPAYICKRSVSEGMSLPSCHNSYGMLPSQQEPTAIQLLWFLISLPWMLALHYFQLLFQHDLWNVGIIHQPIETFLQPDARLEIEWLFKPSATFFADPFGVELDNKRYIVCEEFDYKSAKGHIAAYCLQYDGDGSLVKVFDQPFHLSYPYSFVHNGNHYIVPEQGQSRRVDLYLVPQIQQWKYAATLIENFPALDSTIFQYQDKWWLFCTSLDEGAYSASLYVWYADDLFGPWQPHAANPVKIDVRSARPAGTPFLYQGKLYRPTQDCSIAYGGRLAITQILQLTPKEFQETVVAVIEPNKSGCYPHGIHTIAKFGNNVTLVDGKQIQFRWDAMLGKFKRKFFQTCTY